MRRTPMTTEARRREPLFFRCSFHPQRRARHQWYDERLCEECWQRVRELKAAGF
jgi:hypothetical protein